MSVDNLFLAMVKDNLIIQLPLFLALCVNNCKAFLKYLWTVEGKGIYWKLGIHLFMSCLRVSE